MLAVDISCHYQLLGLDTLKAIMNGFLINFDNFSM